MKKHILLAIGVIGCIGVAKAAPGDRFYYPDQYNGILYEVIDEDVKTARTAKAENIKVGGEKEIPYEGANLTIQTLQGKYDSAIDELNHNMHWQISGRSDIVVGPNVTNKGEIEIPETVVYNGKDYTVTEIGDFSFAYDYGLGYGMSLQKVILPQTVKKIGEGAFFGYENLSIEDLSNLEEIGDYGFYFGKFQKLKIPANISIGKDAFGLCKTEELTLEEGIKDLSFIDFPKLTFVEIPGSVKEIPAGCFKSSKLKTAILHEGIETIGNEAFANCLLNTKDGNPALVIPSTVSIIEDKAFANNNDLTQLVFNEGLNVIGEGAFYACDIKALEIPGTVSEIKANAFSCNKSLNTLILNDGVKTINKDAFKEVNLKKLEIPGSVSRIEAETFANNGELTELILHEGIEEIGEGAFYACDIYELTIPGTISEIKANSFSNNVHLHTLIINEGVKKIDKEAFKNSDLNKLDIPGSVTVIEEGTFAGNTNMAELILHEGLEIIGVSAFDNCGVVDLTIPASVYEICDNAFRNNKNLKYLRFQDGDGNPDPISQLNRIGKSAFESCGAIVNDISFPDNLEIIDNRAFYNVQSITSLYFGSKLNYVGDEAFWRTNINPQSYWVFPKSLHHVGKHAFNTNNKVSTFLDIYYPNPYPEGTDADHVAFGLVDAPTLDNQFNDDYWMYDTVCLHVPYGTVERYRQAEGWKHFRCIIDDILPEESEENDRRHQNADDALAYIIDYLYIVPGDEFDLNKVLLQSGLVKEDDENTFKWRPISNDPNKEGYHEENSKIVILDENGRGEAKAYGNVIALGKRTTTRLDAGHNEKEVQAALGAVIIFVCPTITVVYDKDNAIETNTPSQPAQTRAKAPRRVGEEEGDDNGNTTPNNEATQLQTENSTYSHPVVFNSLPKVQVNPAPNITISNIERASMDAYNEYIDEEGLTKVDNALISSDITQGVFEGSIVPQEPITENRMLVVTLDLDEGIMTGAEEIEIDDKISVAVSGRNLSVIGADEDAEVLVADLNGRIVYSGTEKALSLEPGVYIIRVEDVAFKAIVR